MKLSLKTKLISMFFIFISIPIVILGIISSNMTSNSMEHLIEEELREITSQTAESIEESINDMNRYVKLLSHNKDLSSIAYGDNNKKAKVYEYLKTIYGENEGLIEKIIITDKSGMGVISSNDINYNVDLRDRSYIQNALNEKSKVSEVIISKVSNKPIIAISHPLKLNGKIVGTVTVTMDFKIVSSHVLDIKIGNNGYAFIIDENGLFTYHHDDKKILKENIENNSNEQLHKLVEKMKSKESGEGYIIRGDSKKFVRFTPASNWILAVTADYDEYMMTAYKIKKDTIIIGVVSLLISMILAYYVITRNIIKPIKSLEDLMIKAGKGDLTVESHINTKDEIEVLGHYFNTMIENQSNIIRHVRVSSEDLANASHEVSASSEEVSASTEQITANIQEVAANTAQQNTTIIETSEVLVELSSLIQIASNKALKAKSSSDKTKEVAEKGRYNVEQTVEAIDHINKVSSETAGILNGLNDLSKKVTGIIGTINKISDQTNLLALNAAIEAARAKEGGRGFTVVAQEVRTLSEQTNVEANEISLLVNEMVKEIDRAVISMDQGINVVKKGILVAQETDKSFVSIIGAINKIISDIDQILNVTKDEVASSDQIIHLIDSVASIAETTASNGEQVAMSAQEQSCVIESLASSAEETSAMASNLNDLVIKFKTRGD